MRERVTPLSGFPEWLPQDRIVEQHVLDIIRSTFELHGFAGVETRETADDRHPAGATGWGVRLLDRLVAARFEGHDTSA